MATQESTCRATARGQRGDLGPELEPETHEVASTAELQPEINVATSEHQLETHEEVSLTEVLPEVNVATSARQLQPEVNLVTSTPEFQPETHEGVLA